MSSEEVFARETRIPLRRVGFLFVSGCETGSGKLFEEGIVPVSCGETAGSKVFEGGTVSASDGETFKIVSART